MAVIAESWRDEGRLSKPGVVATVMSNLGLERHLAGLGLALERTAVGDRYVIERMREKGFNVGGEQSGHIILSDYSTTATVWWRRCRCWRWCTSLEAGERGLPAVRAGAAGVAQRSLQGRPAARNPAVAKAIADATRGSATTAGSSSARRAPSQ